MFATKNLVGLRLIVVATMAAEMLAGAALAADPSGDELWTGAAADPTASQGRRHDRGPGRGRPPRAGRGHPRRANAARLPLRLQLLPVGPSARRTPGGGLPRPLRGLLNYATLPFYWWAYEPVAGKTAEADRRAVAAWCREHGIATKGHPLIGTTPSPAGCPPTPRKSTACSWPASRTASRGSAG